AAAGRRTHRDRVVRGGPGQAAPGARLLRGAAAGRHEPAAAVDVCRDRRLRRLLAVPARCRHRQPDQAALMTGISLGMPEVPQRLAARRKSRQLDVGGVLVGGDAPVSVQSMTTTKTYDINATLQQIAELTASGCQIVRVACPTGKDAEALREIA